MSRRRYLASTLELLKSYRPSTPEDQHYRELCLTILGTMENEGLLSGRIVGNGKHYRLSCTVWPVCAATRQVVLHKHALTGHTWPYGGGVEPQDNARLTATARREFAEESGLSPATIERMPLFDNPLVDIHVCPSTVPGKKGTWIVFSIGMLWPARLRADHLQWFRLEDVATWSDAGMRRPALRCLEYLKAL